MLDADSVFDRLLREAANLVPKMSTPKLTAALKVSSALQERITDTLAARLNQEQGIITCCESKSSAVQGVQSIVRTPMLSEELISENNFISQSDNSYGNRNIATSNYDCLPFFSQFNQFAVGQRTATLVTITNPHAAGLAGATVVGTLAPGTALIQQHPHHHHQQQAAEQTHDGGLSPMNSSCIVPVSSNTNNVMTNSGQCSNTVTLGGNGHLMPHMDVLDMKPDPVACLARAAVAGLNTGCETTTSTTTTATLFNCAAPQSDSDQLASLNFVPMSGLTPISSVADGLLTSVSSLPGATTMSTIPGISSIPSPASHHQHQPPPTTVSVLTTQLSATATSVASATGTPAKYTTPIMRSTTAVSKSSSAKLVGNRHGRTTATSIALSLLGGKAGPYRCRECGKEFRILRYLEKHRRIHTGEKPYQCCFCGRLFNDWPNMNRHKRIHTGERPYRCSVCTKTFSQPAVYNEHVKRHTGERPYICAVCSKGFPRAARLAVHMRVHTGERPYPCTSCDRRFSQPHHLSAHLRVHSGDRPFSCSKCDVSFACVSNLRRHRKQVHSITTTSSASVVADQTPRSQLQQQQQALSGEVSSTNSAVNTSTTSCTEMVPASVVAPVSDAKYVLQPEFATFSTSLNDGSSSGLVNTCNMVPGLVFTTAEGGHNTLQTISVSSGNGVSGDGDRVLTLVSSSLSGCDSLGNSSSISGSTLADMNGGGQHAEITPNSPSPASSLASSSGSTLHSDLLGSQTSSSSSSSSSLKAPENMQQNGNVEDVDLESGSGDNQSLNLDVHQHQHQHHHQLHQLHHHQQQEHMQSSSQASTTLIDMPVVVGQAGSRQFYLDHSQQPQHQSMQTTDTSIYLTSMEDTNGTELAHLSTGGPLISTNVPGLRLQQVAGMPLGHFSFTSDIKGDNVSNASTPVVFSTSNVVSSSVSASASVTPIQICYSSCSGVINSPAIATGRNQPSGSTTLLLPSSASAHPATVFSNSGTVALASAQMLTSSTPHSAMLVPIGTPGGFLPSTISSTPSAGTTRWAVATPPPPPPQQQQQQSIAEPINNATVVQAGSKLLSSDQVKASSTLLT